MKQDQIKFNASEYLERIDCALEVTPTLGYLKKLHRQHMLNIPFENLDNFLGNQIILDVSRIYKKVILNKRGGFCYELNGLFYHLLKKLGFDVKIVSARVYGDDGQLRGEFDHMALLVYFENDIYLADVGFGISFKSALQVKPGLLQMDLNTYYKIEKDINDVFILQSSLDSLTFKNEYAFTEVPRRMIEFIGMCEFHNRNKASHLTKSRFITQAKKGGQVTLTDQKLTTLYQGKTEEAVIHNLDEFKVKLYEYFDIQYRVQH